MKERINSCIWIIIICYIFIIPITFFSDFPIQLIELFGIYNFMIIVGLWVIDDLKLKRLEEI